MRAACLDRAARPLLLALLVGALGAAALPAQQRFVRSDYAQSSVDVPMRDGVTLHLEIFAPTNTTDPLPFLLQRTPYGVGAAGGRLAGSYKELAEDGYIFVFQDIRGQYKSGGTFVMQRPPRRRTGRATRSTRAPTRTTPSTGCSRNVPKNNGRVGMLGVSLRRLDHRDGRCSTRTRRSRPSRRRPRRPTCGSATTSTTTARSG